MVFVCNNESTPASTTLCKTPLLAARGFPAKRAIRSLQWQQPGAITTTATVEPRPSESESLTLPPCSSVFELRPVAISSRPSSPSSSSRTEYCWAKRRQRQNDICPYSLSPTTLARRSQVSPAALGASMSALSRSQSLPSRAAETTKPAGGEASAEMQLSLPVEAAEARAEGLPAISADTLAAVLQGDLGKLYDRIIIIDARFDYEYEAGHIASATNITTRSAADRMLFDVPSGGSRVLVVVHCEYSRCRGPALARHIRSMDRRVHGASGFPNLHYPELYLLRGGYRNLFGQHPTLCQPIAYMPMHATDAARARAFAMQMPPGPRKGTRRKARDVHNNNNKENINHTNNTNIRIRVSLTFGPSTPKKSRSLFSSLDLSSNDAASPIISNNLYLR